MPSQPGQGAQNPFGQSLQGGRGQFQTPQRFGGGQQNFGFGQSMNYSPFSGGLGSLYGSMGGFGGMGGFNPMMGFGGFNSMMGGLGGFGFNPMMGYGGFGGGMGGFGPMMGGFSGFSPMMGGYNPFFGGIGGLGQNSYFNQRMPPQGQFQSEPPMMGAISSGNQSQGEKMLPSQGFQPGYGESPSSVPTPMPGMKQPDAEQKYQAQRTPQQTQSIEQAMLLSRVGDTAGANAILNQILGSGPMSINDLNQQVDRLVRAKYPTPLRQERPGMAITTDVKPDESYRSELMRLFGPRYQEAQPYATRDTSRNPYTGSMLTMDRPPPSMTTPEQRMKQREQMFAMQNLATRLQGPNFFAPSPEINPFGSSYDSRYI